RGHDHARSRLVVRVVRPGGGARRKACHHLCPGGGSAGLQTSVHRDLLPGRAGAPCAGGRGARQREEQEGLISWKIEVTRWLRGCSRCCCWRQPSLPSSGSRVITPSSSLTTWSRWTPCRVSRPRPTYGIGGCR